MKTPTIKRSFEYVEGKTYYYIGARSAYEYMPIGLFESREDAELHVDVFTKRSIVKKATKQQIETFFGLK